MSTDWGRPDYKDFMGIAASVAAIDRAFTGAAERKWKEEDRKEKKENKDQYKALRGEDGFLLDEMANPENRGVVYSGFGGYQGGEQLGNFNPAVSDMARDDQLEADTKSYESLWAGKTLDELGQMDFNAEKKPLAANRAMARLVKRQADNSQYEQTMIANSDKKAYREYEQIQALLGDINVAVHQRNRDVAIASVKKLTETVPMPYRFLGTTEDGKVRIGMYKEGKLTGEETLTVEEFYTKASKWSGPEYARHRRAFNKWKNDYNRDQLEQKVKITKDGQTAYMVGFIDDSGNHITKIFSADNKVRMMNANDVWEQGWELVDKTAKKPLSVSDQIKVAKFQDYEAEKRVGRFKEDFSTKFPNVSNDDGEVGGFLSELEYKNAIKWAAEEGVEIVAKKGKADKGTHGYTGTVYTVQAVRSSRLAGGGAGGGGGKKDKFDPNALDDATDGKKTPKVADNWAPNQPALPPELLPDPINEAKYAQWDEEAAAEAALRAELIERSGGRGLPGGLTQGRDYSRMGQPSALAEAATEKAKVEEAIRRKRLYGSGFHGLRPTYRGK